MQYSNTDELLMPLVTVHGRFDRHSYRHFLVCFWADQWTEIPQFSLVSQRQSRYDVEKKKLQYFVSRKSQFEV